MVQIVCHIEHKMNLKYIHLTSQFNINSVSYLLFFRYITDQGKSCLKAKQGSCLQCTVNHLLFLVRRGVVQGKGLRGRLTTTHPPRNTPSLLEEKAGSVTCSIIQTLSVRSSSQEKGGCRPGVLKGASSTKSDFFYFGLS